jgi:hypothetical protein
MSSMGEVGAELSSAANKAGEAIGPLQEALIALEGVQNALGAIDPDSPWPDVHNMNGLAAQAVQGAGDTIQLVVNAIQSIDAVATRFPNADSEATGSPQPPARPATPATGASSMAAEANQPQDNETDAAEAATPSPYQAQLDSIHQALAAGTAPVNIENHHANGGYLTIYTVADDPTKLIKTLHRKYWTDGREPMAADFVADEYRGPLEAGRGAAGLEQIVDYIPPSGNRPAAIIVEKIEGQEVQKMTSEEQNSIPLEHYRQLMQTCHELASRGLAPEFASFNIIYNPQQGFVIIDYHFPLEGRPVMTAEEQAQWFGLPGVVFSTNPVNNQFPEAGRRYLTAYREAFGDASTESFKQQLQHNYDLYAQGGPPSPHIIVPDDI